LAREIVGESEPDRLARRYERTEQAVPDDENAAVVLVEIDGVRAVMDRVCRGPPAIVMPMPSAFASPKKPARDPTREVIVPS